MNKIKYFPILGICFVLLIAQSCVSRVPENKPVALTIFHNNDGESSLVADDEGYGSASAFVALLRKLRSKAQSEGRATLTLSSGDNYLSGVAFTASRNDNVYYDAKVISAIDYDALALGNHDFDFGPDLLADFINSVDKNVPYVASNIDTSQEAKLNSLVKSRRLVSSAIVISQGQSFGLIGLMTPELKAVSSPRNVKVNPNLKDVVAEQLAYMEKWGVNKIVIISHLQDLQEEMALIKELRGIDVVIGGGGDELLKSEGYPLIPKDQEEEEFGSYPLLLKDADGRDVPVVTTPGKYRYIGRLDLTFDAEGHISGVPTGGLVRVAGPETGVPDAVANVDAEVQINAVQPVLDFEKSLDVFDVAKTEVKLDGTRHLIRTRETNFGNLIADALLWQARKLAADFGAPSPTVAIQNGGSVRKSVVIEAGQPITSLNLFTALPFSNFLTIVPDIPPEQFKLILENAASQIEGVKGRFAQVSGFKVTYDLSKQPLKMDYETNAITQEGHRVITVLLDDGRHIVRDGKVVSGAPKLTITAPRYIVKGGDQYPFNGAPFTSLSVEYREAVENYLKAPESEGGLGAVVSKSQYPPGGGTRVIFR